MVFFTSAPFLPQKYVIFLLGAQSVRRHKGDACLLSQRYCCISSINSPSLSHSMNCFSVHLHVVHCTVIQRLTALVPADALSISRQVHWPVKSALKMSAQQGREPLVHLPWPVNHVHPLQKCMFIRFTHPLCIVHPHPFHRLSAPHIPASTTPATPMPTMTVSEPTKQETLDFFKRLKSQHANKASGSPGQHQFSLSVFAPLPLITLCTDNGLLDRAGSAAYILDIQRRNAPRSQ